MNGDDNYMHNYYAQCLFSKNHEDVPLEHNMIQQNEEYVVI